MTKLSIRYLEINLVKDVRILLSSKLWKDFKFKYIYG